MPEATKVTLILEPAVWAFLDGSRSKVKQSRSEYIAGILTEMHAIALEDAAKQTADQEAILAQEEQLAICAAATAHLERLETALRTLYHAAEAARSDGGFGHWDALDAALAVAETVLSIGPEDLGDEPEVEKTRAVVLGKNHIVVTPAVENAAEAVISEILGEELTEEERAKERAAYAELLQDRAKTGERPETKHQTLAGARLAEITIETTGETVKQPGSKE